MIKKVSAWLFVLFAAVLIIPEVTALAAPELRVSVSAGIDGKSKSGKGMPVTITVENSGTSFSGDIVVDVQESYNIGTGRAIAFDIGSGETKSVSLIFPNSADGYISGMGNTKRIFFYEGGWKKGKEIAHKGSGQFISSAYPNDTAFISTFTNNADRLGALKKVSVTGSQRTELINASKLDPSNFPDEALGWESVDFMIIDEYPLAYLQVAKQEALLGWVRSGGVLIIGGSDNVEAEAGIFSEYLPMVLKDRIETNPATFNEWAMTEGFDQPIASYASELREGAKSVLKEGENHLIAYEKVGSGFIYQTAFSVGDDPIAKMAGMSAFWGKIFDSTGRSFQQTNNQGQSPLEAIVHTVGETNELFPSFEVSAPLMFGIIILYILLIIPVLYFVLKRKDKREYTWWLIPIIALLTSLAIFGYGAKDRIGRAQIQQTAILNVEPDGGMTGYYAESILSNKSGDFTFKAPLGTTFSASLGSGFFGPNMKAIHKQVIVEKDVANSTLHFRDVGYWNVATVYGETKVENIGELASKLAVKDKKLTGTVTNEFPFALTDVSIWSGTDLIPIGNLGPGETAKIDEELKIPILLSRRPINSYGMNPQQMNRNDLVKMRKDGVLSFSGDHMNTTGKPVVIGYTDTGVIPITLENGKPDLSALTMIVQPIDVDLTFSGAFIVEPEMMNSTIVSEDTHYEQYVDFQSNEYYFEEAVYILTSKLSEDLMEMNTNWTSIDLTKVQKNLYDVSLLNVKTGLFELKEPGDVKITKDTGDYLSPEGEIVIRIAFHNARDGNSIRIPELRLSGVTTQ